MRLFGKGLRRDFTVFLSIWRRLMSVWSGVFMVKNSRFFLFWGLKTLTWGIPF